MKGSITTQKKCYSSQTVTLSRVGVGMGRNDSMIASEPFLEEELVSVKR